MHKRAATSHTSACHRQHTECLLARMRRDTSLDAGERASASPRQSPQRIRASLRFVMGARRAGEVSPACATSDAADACTVALAALSPHRPGERNCAGAAGWSPGQPPARPAAAEAPSDTPGRLRAWYFAEGNSHHDFQTFFTLLNLSDQSASVTGSYDRDDNIRPMQWLGIEPHGRVSLNANDVVGPHAFGASFTADQDIVVERATTWGPGQNGETTIGFAPQGGATGRLPKAPRSAASPPTL